MADLSSVVSKMNDVEITDDAPHSEALMTKIGENLNALIDRTSFIQVSFTASGSWLAPANVTKVWVEGIGGGGGGGTGGTAVNTPGSGGSSGQYGFRIVTVVPGTNYTVTVGAGGAGGTTVSPFTASDGGSSSFGTLAIFRGGKAGQSLGGRGGRGGMNSAAGGNSVSLAVYSTTNSDAGEDGIGFPGGSAGAIVTGNPGGGGGGGTVFGAGGNGGNGGAAGNNATANTGAGGGGGGEESPGSPHAGGAGGSGRINLYYFTQEP